MFNFVVEFLSCYIRFLLLWGYVWIISENLQETSLFNMAVNYKECLSMWKCTDLTSIIPVN